MSTGTQINCSLQPGITKNANYSGRRQIKVKRLRFSSGPLLCQ
ncbi:Hypothetical protein BIBO2_2851 [Brucella sp. BO2]|nr:Hypothetical protein BIBO2_2851 [Brucella sp. BO2]